jgi:hypothetical protein
MQQVVESYWLFGVICLVIALVLMRLLFRERITLQGSMSYLAFLLVLGFMALFPRQAESVAHALGFTLLSNFFFCVAIAALAILHLRALVTLSRVQLRSIALTQELAILQEKLERVIDRQEAHANVSTQSGRSDPTASSTMSVDRRAVEHDLTRGAGAGQLDHDAIAVGHGIVLARDADREVLHAATVRRARACHGAHAAGVRIDLDEPARDTSGEVVVVGLDLECRRRVDRRCHRTPQNDRARTGSRERYDATRDRIGRRGRVDGAASPDRGPVSAGVSGRGGTEREGEGKQCDLHHVVTPDHEATHGAPATIRRYRCVTSSLTYGDDFAIADA